MTSENRYMIDIFGNGREFDVLYYLNKNGFRLYLDYIRTNFQRTLPADLGDSTKIYYIIQDNFEAVKIGLSKNPYKRLKILQTGNPNKLLMLYFYEVEKHNEQFRGIEMFQKCIPIDNFSYESKQYRFMAGTTMEGEWFKPDDRSFRILIRKGFEVIQWQQKAYI